MSGGCLSLPARPFHPVHLRHDAGGLPGQPVDEIPNFGVLPEGVEAVPLRSQFPLRENGMQELVTGRAKPGDPVQHILTRMAESRVTLIVLAAGDQMVPSDPHRAAAAQFAATRYVIGAGRFAGHPSFQWSGRTVQADRPGRSNKNCSRARTLLGALADRLGNTASFIRV